MKKIIATVIIVLAVMFTPQGVYADSEEQNNEYCLLYTSDAADE